MIRLENISEVNWRIPLAVTKQQEKFVSNPMKLLARAYAYREQGSFEKMDFTLEEAVRICKYNAIKMIKRN